MPKEISQEAAEALIASGMEVIGRTRGQEARREFLGTLTSEERTAVHNARVQVSRRNRG